MIDSATKQGRKNTNKMSFGNISVAMKVNFK